MFVLLTGATGKVGSTFIERFLHEPKFAGSKLRALCHNRVLPEQDRLEVCRGSIADRASVAAALRGITHVIHLATVKEDPDLAMDVTVKGLFWLLEEFRGSPTARQFVLIGGDAGVGHIINRYDEPVTEASPRRAYPGVYALTKVLEEVMLDQYYSQYDLNGTVLRAPWIMEKDDFKFALSFGEDQFGGPPWDGLISATDRRRFAEEGRVPLLLDAEGLPLRRNFIHVTDLVTAMLTALDHPKSHQQLFNVAMTEPVDYGFVANHLKQTRSLEPIEIPTPFHSNLLDNAKARLHLGWKPQYDTARLIDEAFAYQRAAGDERKIWYQG